MTTNPAERGWGNPPVRHTVRVPCAGVPLNLDPRVAPLFAALIERVEKIRGRGWMISAGGYHFRPVRGYELKYAKTKNPDYLSLHSWAVAADFRAATNPQTRNGPTDMPGNMERLCADLGLVWGGTFSGDRRDPMHVEVAGTPADAARHVAALAAPPRTPLTNPAQEDDEMTEDDRRLLQAVNGKLDNLLGQFGYTIENGVPAWRGVDVWDGSKRKLSLLDLIRETHRELMQKIPGRAPADDTLLGHVLNIARKTGADGK